MVDEKTQLKFSSFHATKRGMVEPTCEQFEKWKSEGKTVKQIRCDNGGENLLLKKELNCANCKLYPQFELIGRDTPQ
jgi:hypothetical protein